MEMGSLQQWWADEKAYYASLASRVPRLCRNLALASCIGTAGGLVLWCAESFRKAFWDLLDLGSYEGSCSPEETAIFFGVVITLFALFALFGLDEEAKKRSVRHKSHLSVAPGSSRRAHRRRVKP
jgi:hypothetical protein